MILYIITVGLFTTCIFLYIEVNRYKAMHTKWIDIYDVVKKEHGSIVEEKKVLSDILENISLSIQSIMPAILEIKKSIFISKADMNSVAHSIQSTNNNLVSNFSGIVAQINDTMLDVMNVVVVTEKKLISQSNHESKLDDSDSYSTLLKEDIMKTIQSRYDTLLQQIIDELMLTHQRKTEDILILDSIYQSVQRVQGFSEEVTEIANGIGLISLNASIEAARAGVKGMSFAVVAKEVGKMATLSETTAKKIKIELKKTNDTIKSSISEIKEARQAETEYINSTIAIIKDVFASIIHSLFQLNNTLLGSMGSSSEIKKSVESTINALQLEHISTFLSSNQIQAFDDLLKNVTIIHQIIPDLEKIDHSSKDNIILYIAEYEKLDREIRTTWLSNLKAETKEDITFF